jgi:3-oxoacyl-[acyl-carrier-protein] synthase-3
MPCFAIPNVEIKGIAAAVPQQSESNWDYDRLTKSEQKLLVKTTGVETRRIAPKGMATSDLCYEAAARLMKELNWEKEDVQVLIFLSQSRDYYLPATAIILQDRLGLSKHCMAFDIGLGCSGFVYGLSVIGSIMSTAGLKRGLLLMGDISSATCAYEDKSTYPLFGDAGTATALEFTPDAKAMHFNLNSDGSGYQAIMIPDGGIRNLVSEASFEKKQIDEGIERCNLNLALNGLDVFNFSIREVPPAVNALLDRTAKRVEDFDYFLMHQANLLMNETIRKKLKWTKEQVPYSIRDYGNTSSASIPLTMVSQLSKEALSKPMSCCLAGFGVGLSWGIATVETSGLVCPEIIEL